MQAEKKCNRVALVHIKPDGERIPHKILWDHELIGPDYVLPWKAARKAIETGERQILSKSGRWSLEITPSYEPKPPEPEPPKPFDLGEFIECHLKNPEVLLLYS